MLTCKNFNTNKVLQSRLILEEYGPAIEYIKGEKNLAIDALSRLPNNGNQETTQRKCAFRKFLNVLKFRNSFRCIHFLMCSLLITVIR